MDGRRVDKVPKGWETLREIAAAEGIKPESARRKLNDAVAAGYVEARKFRVWTGKQMAMVTHWRFPKQLGDRRKD